VQFSRLLEGSEIKEGRTTKKGRVWREFFTLVLEHVHQGKKKSPIVSIQKNTTRRSILKVEGKPRATYLMRESNLESILEREKDHATLRGRRLGREKGSRGKSRGGMRSWPDSKDPGRHTIDRGKNQ